MTGCESPASPLSASLQLEVLTNLANETNIPTVLREFQVRAGAAPSRGAQESCLQLIVRSVSRPASSGPRAEKLLP